MYVLLGLLALLALWFVLTYNALVGARNKAKKAWSDVDVQLKRRYDLIPPLTELVKEYGRNEQEVFMQVAEARTRAMEAASASEHAEAEPRLTESVGSLLLLAEAYPDLKAHENYRKLMGELSSIESAIESSRRYYNGSVLDFNTRIGQFPTLLVARMGSFSAFELFDLDTSTA